MILKYNKEGYPYEDQESAGLEERIKQLEKQKELLKTTCKKAGARIRDLEGEISIIKGIGINSPEMKEAKARIEIMKKSKQS